MPLGEKEGWEKSDSKFCGLETEFSADLRSLLSFNTNNGRFDFVLAPLMNPSYRPSLVDQSNSETHSLPFEWRYRVTGKISSWIDLDSEDEIVREDSETILNYEIALAKQFSIRSCLLPTPKGTSCANYARCVNQILQGLTEMELWLRIPLMDSESEDSKDSWEIWNSFRLLCGHDSRLFVALDIQMMLPSDNAIGRWFGEAVKAAIISTECFILVKDYPCLLKNHRELLTRFFHHSVQVIVSGKPVRSHQKDSVDNPDGIVPHPHKPYLDYFSNLFCKLEPLSARALKEVIHRDRLHTPLQPLKDNLEAHSYEMIERDSVKYTQYQRAIAKALEERVPNEKVSELTTVLMIVGAGRGGLVRASLQAAEESGRKLKVYAVEKNPYAVVTLHDMVKTRGWEGFVTIISRDMRFWNAPEKADMLVSELLGSFGDNELSPECLDGAQRFLKLDGILIPSSYTSFIQPITNSKLYNAVKATNNLSNFATAYTGVMHSVARLAPSQPIFTFTHPEFSRKPNNQRYKNVRFNLPSDTGSALVHGFAGYFEAVLYGDVILSIEPTTATPNMFGWNPMFFPLMKPVEVHPNSTIEAHFWRCSDSTKVWYEWSVSLPTLSPIHNPNGSSYSMGLLGFV